MTCGCVLVGEVCHIYPKTTFSIPFERIVGIYAPKYNPRHILAIFHTPREEVCHECIRKKLQRAEAQVEKGNEVCARNDKGEDMLQCLSWYAHKNAAEWVRDEQAEDELVARVSLPLADRDSIRVPSTLSCSTGAPSASAAG